MHKKNAWTVAVCRYSTVCMAARKASLRCENLPAWKIRLQVDAPQQPVRGEFLEWPGPAVLTQHVIDT